MRKRKNNLRRLLAGCLSFAILFTTVWQNPTQVWADSDTEAVVPETEQTVEALGTTPDLSGITLADANGLIVDAPLADGVDFPIDMDQTYTNMRSGLDMPTVTGGTINFADANKTYVFSIGDYGNCINTMNTAVTLQKLYESTDHAKVEFLGIQSNNSWDYYNDYDTGLTLVKSFVKSYGTSTANIPMIWEYALKITNTKYPTQYTYLGKRIRTLLNSWSSWKTPLVCVIHNQRIYYVSQGSANGDDLAKVIQAVAGTDSFTTPWQFPGERVLAENKAVYAAARTDDAALKYYKTSDLGVGNEGWIDYKNTTVAAKAKEITANCTTDFEKAKAIHDWVSSNIAYDNYNLNKSSTQALAVYEEQVDQTGGINDVVYQASEVLEKKMTVCTGFANLYSALCRAAGIPCKNVVGYGNNEDSWTSANVALGANHEWNEVFADADGDGTGEWIIVDTTWDTNLSNSNESPTVTGSSVCDQTYFNCSIEVLSQKHRITRDGRDELIIGGTLNVEVTDGQPAYAKVTITPSDNRNFQCFCILVTNDLVGSTLNFITGTQSTKESVSAEVRISPGYENKITVIGYNMPKQYVKEGSYCIQSDEAVLDKSMHTLTFDSVGGTIVDPVQVKHGELAVKPENPTKSGYDFAGWYMDPDYTFYFNFNSEVKNDYTLYAKWNTETPKYTITFDSMGGSAVADQKVESGTYATKPENPVREGYTFGGWCTDKDCFYSFVFSMMLVNADRTLYAKWISNAATTYTVTFQSQGGTSVDAQTVEENKTASKPADPTRTGYQFAGWYLDSGYTKAYSFATKVTGNLTLYARWTADEPEKTSYTVSFVSNGGTQVEAQEVVSGNRASRPVNVTKTGYSLAGWYVDEALTKAFDFTKDLVTQNITLYAKWEQRSYKVSFNCMSAPTKVSQATVLYGKTVTAPTAPTWKYHKLVGWYTSSSFTQAYDFSKVVTKDTTLYAKWEINIVGTGTSTAILNRRKGPGITYDKYSTTIPKNTKINLLSTTAENGYYPVYYNSVICYVTASYVSVGTSSSTPAQVKGVKASSNKTTSVKVSWSAASGAKSYTLERAVGTSKSWSVVKTGITSTSYTDTKRKAATQYRYRVKAVNQAGKAGTTSAELTTATAPNKVKITKAKPKGKSVTLSWKKNTAVSGYKIYVKKPGSKTYVLQKKGATAKSSGITVKKLKKGTYSFMVRAYKKAGKTTVLSANSNVKKVKVN